MSFAVSLWQVATITNFVDQELPNGSLPLVRHVFQNEQIVAYRGAWCIGRSIECRCWCFRRSEPLVSGRPSGHLTKHIPCSQGEYVLEFGNLNLVSRVKNIQPENLRSTQKVDERFVITVIIVMPGGPDTQIGSGQVKNLSLLYFFQHVLKIGVELRHSNLDTYKTTSP